MQVLSLETFVGIAMKITSVRLSSTSISVHNPKPFPFPGFSE
jgi:hypothetical protein